MTYAGISSSPPRGGLHTSSSSNGNHRLFKSAANMSSSSAIASTADAPAAASASTSAAGAGASTGPATSSLTDGTTGASTSAFGVFLSQWTSFIVHVDRAERDPSLLSTSFHDVWSGAGRATTADFTALWHAAKTCKREWQMCCLLRSRLRTAQLGSSSGYLATPPQPSQSLSCSRGRNGSASHVRGFSTASMGCKPVAAQGPVALGLLCWAAALTGDLAWVFTAFAEEIKTLVHDECAAGPQQRAVADYRGVAAGLVLALYGWFEAVVLVASQADQAAPMSTEGDVLRFLQHVGVGVVQPAVMVPVTSQTTPQRSPSAVAVDWSSTRMTAASTPTALIAPSHVAAVPVISIECPVPTLIATASSSTSTRPKLHDEGFALRSAASSLSGLSAHDRRGLPTTPPPPPRRVLPHKGAVPISPSHRATSSCGGSPHHRLDDVPSQDTRTAEPVTTPASRTPPVSSLPPTAPVPRRNAARHGESLVSMPHSASLRSSFSASLADDVDSVRTSHYIDGVRRDTDAVRPAKSLSQQLNKKEKKELAKERKKEKKREKGRGKGSPSGSRTNGSVSNDRGESSSGVGVTAASPVAGSGGGGGKKQKGEENCSVM